MKKQTLLFPILAAAILFQTPSWALQQIIRPYQSVRSAGMGGLRMTTGLYDENFFNNPARVTANPKSKFTILGLTGTEVNSGALTAASQAGGGSDALTVASNLAGQNIHARTQIILPAYYHAAIEERKWAFAAGLITSLQLDGDLRQSFQTDLSAFVDTGLAITVGRKLLEENKLSVGITAHLMYRAAANPNYGLIDYIRGTLPSASNIGSQGGMIDFDIGGTYKIVKWGEFDVSAALAIQNVLGGNYSNLQLNLIPSLSSPPPTQARSMGLGGTLSRESWWVFNDTVFGLELTDIFNNGSGSLFRTLHIGGETHWKSIAVRLGLNQGYFSAGLGFDFHFFNLDLATYGEEMGLNAGTLQDRRYTLNFGFHI